MWREETQQATSLRTASWIFFLRPFGACSSRLDRHGLRGELHSVAASRLGAHRSFILSDAQSRRDHVTTQTPAGCLLLTRL
jgi:hypothetical protein